MALGKHLQTAQSVSRRVSLFVGALAVACLGLALALLAARFGALPPVWQSGLVAGVVSGTMLLLTIVAIGFALLRKSLAGLQAAELAENAARVDPVTLALTRGDFLDELRRRVRTAGDRRHACVMLDLDHLKALNDTFGHAAGDEALARLVRICREALPGAVVGRLGGDEFALLLSDCASRDEVVRTTRALLDRLRLPAQINGRTMRLSATAGLAVAPDDTRIALELVNLADLALYKAKAARGTVLSYNARMLVDDRYARLLARELRAAIYLNQLDVHYQPVVAEDGVTRTAFEALIRWHHPLRGSIPPSEFITVAEQSTLIEEVGEWVIRRVVRDAVRFGTGQFGINVSPVQLKQPGFSDFVLGELAAAGLPASRLVLEITETVFLDFGSVERANLDGLRQAGVMIVLDDFGAGFASLQYLRKFRFDCLKIDRSYVHAAGSSAVDMTFVSAITELARALGTRVLAEGVETEEQYLLMKAAGCQRFQGYYFGRPAVLPDSAAPSVACIEPRRAMGG
ncbi:putative bifunctional diguanylate cyclase/phosphodiesterase [Pleomorphomonas koreensis]|uniref:putative bifunctional diguanylate cyclase/phosphodiesterase n=1 Tax=Pleomorphomonas koreensis TaxID=257440 RepID=UPI00041B6AC7|nr:bifunctional diguanylate cyclase/phosphodiesterase [Pleomorphomonas koreensis]